MKSSLIATSIDAQTTGKVNRLPSAEYLRECFNYNQSTGDLIWRERPLSHFKTPHGRARFNTIFNGKVAGHKDRNKRGKPQGIVIRMSSFSGRENYFQSHQIIFTIMGIPLDDGMEVDHKNGNPWDNRWENLRAGTHQQNGCNTSAPSNKKRHLPRGVHQRNPSHGFSAKIGCKGKDVHLGTFSTVEAAEQAYKEAAQRLFGDFAYHASRD